MQVAKLVNYVILMTNSMHVDVVGDLFMRFVFIHITKSQGWNEKGVVECCKFLSEVMESRNLLMPIITFDHLKFNIIAAHISTII